MESTSKAFSKSASGKPRARKKGLETRQKIIDVARHILIEEGYENFILRRVAQEADIKPGNLQYYFSSKKELLSAVLLPEISRYEDVYDQFAERHLSAESLATELVDFLLKEIKLKSTTNIWYVVWAQSAHDEDLAEMMQDWYQEYMESLKSLFKLTVPGLSDRRAGHAASMLTALMDGLTNQVGHGRHRHRIHNKIEQSISESLIYLLQPPPIEERSI